MGSGDLIAAYEELGSWQGQFQNGLGPWEAEVGVRSVSCFGCLGFMSAVETEGPSGVTFERNEFAPSVAGFTVMRRNV